MTEQPERREIDLHRRVCVITPERIDIRPARSAAIAPLIGFFLGVGAFLAVLFWLEALPFYLALALMGGAIILVPFSGMGFVYSIYGANVVIDRTKQTAVWQQGLFGMGVGTSDLAPFAKIEQIEVDELSRDPQEGRAQDFAQFEIAVRKTSGRSLSLGQITVPRAAAAEGLARARALGEAAAAMTERPLHIETSEQRRQRRKSRERGAAAGV
ncbi:MAG: hypothetical protein WEE64_02690 [Dehalococcoidia bacterium]